MIARGRWLIGLAAASACASPQEFECQSDDQCKLAGEQGICQDGGHCSYPDPDCPSGQRYPEGVGGGLGGECVDGSGTSTSSGTTTGTASTTTSSSSGVGEESTTTGTTSSESSTTDPSTGSSTTGAGCPPSATFMWAEEADVQWPMQLQTSMVLPGNPQFAYSQQAELGTITFQLDVPCQGDYLVWALVYDFSTALNDGNPDSFYVSSDGGGESIWRYGCTTYELPDQSWSWQLARAGQSGQCDEMQDWILSLDPGTHTVVLRNREGGAFQLNVAAIAALVVTDDPQYDPHQDYDPGG